MQITVTLTLTELDRIIKALTLLDKSTIDQMHTRPDKTGTSSRRSRKQFAEHMQLMIEANATHQLSRKLSRVIDGRTD